MPDRSGRHCFVCGQDGDQIVADKWVCRDHAKGQETKIPCSSCNSGRLIIRWQVARPTSIIFDPSAPVYINPPIERFVTCSWCQAKTTLPESALGEAMATAKKAEEKRQAEAAIASEARRAEQEALRELQRAAKAAADAAKLEAERTRLVHEHQRIQAELNRLAERSEIVEAKPRHVEVPE